jgi:peroxiredoxin
MRLKKRGRFFLGDYRIFSVLLLTAYCLLLTSVYAEPPSPFAGDKLINRQAPEFRLKDVNGREVSLASYKGTVVLLNFWATWCPSCRDEMSSLSKLSGQLKNRKFSIIAVSTDRSVSDVKDYLKKHPSDLNVLVDHSLSVSRSLYKVFVLPTSFLIDKDGIIVEKYYGGEDWTDPEVVRKIESHL